MTKSDFKNLANIENLIPPRNDFFKTVIILLNIVNSTCILRSVSPYRVDYLPLFFSGWKWCILKVFVFLTSIPIIDQRIIFYKLGIYKDKIYVILVYKKANYFTEYLYLILCLMFRSLFWLQFFENKFVKIPVALGKWRSLKYKINYRFTEKKIENTRLHSWKFGLAKF